jgi:Icc-related predicted phosphoesterase
MKLLLFSDLHKNTSAATQLVRLSRDADVLIGAGDFANVRQGISACIEILKQVQKPAVLVPGNNESFDELVNAGKCWPTATVLHGTGTEISGVPFFGLGGGIPITPFGDWSFDLSEEAASHLLHNCPPRAVLVSHSPPKGAVDQSSSGQSLGSTAVRDAVLRLKPLLVVCGHIHASAGKNALLGNTPVFNAGPHGTFYTLDAP